MGKKLEESDVNLNVCTTRFLFSEKNMTVVFSLTGVGQKEKVKVTFGFNPKRKEHFGIMMYHKNRLIKPYEKVGCQLKVT